MQEHIILKCQNKKNIFFTRDVVKAWKQKQTSHPSRLWVCQTQSVGVTHTWVPQPWAQVEAQLPLLGSEGKN